MATDMFLKLGDIKGESKDQQHRDEMDIHTLSWGINQSGTMHTGSGGGAGKVSIRNLSIGKLMDKASANLMAACSSGRHYPEATLTIRKAGGNSSVEYAVFKLKQVMISSYDTHGEKDFEQLKEAIVLNFAQVEYSYQPQNADGGKDGGAIKYGWNVRENIKV